MARGTFQWFVAVAAILAATAALSRPFFDPRAEKRDAIDANPVFSARARDPACHAAQFVSTGGLAPRDPHTLAVRWAGYSNFELAYGGKIILLDAYFDRGSNYPPLGFAAADVKRANVILIGHGHFDHMSDAASIAARTGSIVVGAPLTTEKLLAQKVDPKQIRTVTGKGREELKFQNFTVEPILGRHGEPPAAITSAFIEALQHTTPRLTAE